MPKADSRPTIPAVPELGLTVRGQTKVSSGLDAALTLAKKRFDERNPTSAKLFEEATEYLPGGNTRTLFFGEDGHITDFVGELTAALYGHSHPLIQASLISTINTVGLNLGSTIAQEAKHAKLICERFSLSKARFCNSGTEDNIHALAGVRYFTGKRKIVVFSGGYHGAVLGFWDGVQENGVDKHEWVIGRYNDVEGAKKLIDQDDIAAVLAEGMQGAGECIIGTNEFLMQIQESAKKVMTSRLGPGGLQAIEGLKPDLTTSGKYLCGESAFGAFGGRTDIMAVYDPRSPNSLAYSGTFNNNTLAVNAGFVGLSEIWKPNEITKGAKDTKVSVIGRGALSAIHFSAKGTTEISCREAIDKDWGLKDLFYMEMMEDGLWALDR
ncbi:PLP-dependent transferase [Acephala macrosclerotiorum]|nr:PLP-dependent transferase [Acephala macrosclerotiorum]